jgi:hypothetical protein
MRACRAHNRRVRRRCLSLRRSAVLDSWPALDGGHVAQAREESGSDDEFHQPRPPSPPPTATGGALVSPRISPPWTPIVADLSATRVSCDFRRKHLKRLPGGQRHWLS